MVDLNYKEPDQLSDLIKLSKENGYVTTNQVFAAIEKESVPIEEVDRICDQLLDMGILIKDDDEIDNQPETQQDNFVSSRNRVDYQQIFNEILEIDQSLDGYIKKLKKIAAPYTGEQDSLVDQIFEGNEYARNRLIEIYLKSVVNIALNYSKRYELPIKDAIQDGNIGLITAIDRLSIDNKHTFVNSVHLRIHSTIFREDISISKSCYIPVHFKEKLYKAFDVLSEHNYINQNSYDIEFENKIVDKLCEELGEDKNIIGKLISLINPPISIDDPSQQFYAPKSKPEALSLLHEKEFEQKVAEALKTLKKRERFIMELRSGITGKRKNSLKEISSFLGESKEKVMQFSQIAEKILQHPLKTKIIDSLEPKVRFVMEQLFDVEWPGEKTLEEIGSILGLTRERVRQIESKALSKLRHPTRSRDLKIFYD